jgi:hypothetical protein
MQIKDENRFETRDFYIAVFLLCKGLKISSVNRSNPRTVFFAFIDIESRESLVEDFLFGRALVEPKSFISAIKEIKQLLYSND